MEETSALVRPARTRQPPAVYTPSEPGTDNEINRVSYALNRKKTLRKKLEATEREWDVKIENKSGSLVLEFTPAPYEVFKQTVKTYYEQGYKSRIRIDEDKNRVDESISVFGGKCSSKKSQLFRVNFFKTTSRVTASGKCLTLFTENDLPKILQELSQISLQNSLLVKRQTDNTTLNSKIAEACRLGIQSNFYTLRIIFLTVF